MRKFLLGLILAAAMVSGTAAPALAVPLHQHLLDTPGAVDIKIARGLCTADAHGQHDTAFHNFHSNVHVGVFLDGDNPNTVTTTSC